MIVVGVQGKVPFCKVHRAPLILTFWQGVMALICPCCDEAAVSE